MGVALGLLGLAALAGAFWMVRRRKNRGGGGSGGEGGEGVEDSPHERQELYAGPTEYGHSGYQKQQEYFGAGDGVKEKSEGPVSELAGTETRYELP